MNESSYINKVKDIINSNKGDLDIVELIANLVLPPEPTALESLIYGESKQIERVKSYLESATDDDLDVEDPAVVATTIVSLLKSYIGDYDCGIEYKYRFQLQATYQCASVNNIGREYLELIRDISAKGIPQALEKLTNWEKELPKKLPLFKNDKCDCLLFSTKPIYQIRAYIDGRRVIISDGIIEHGDERDINTLVNNL